MGGSDRSRVVQLLLVRREDVGGIDVESPHPGRSTITCTPYAGVPVCRFSGSCLQLNDIRASTRLRPAPRAYRAGVADVEMPAQP
jgi:hypothetical protein